VAPVGVEMALQLPEELPARVRELARQIAAPEDRVESKALAIQGYLQAHCRYDLEAPELPEGADFVDRFLFEGGRGYCNHYASAMAVLCRAVGVPARLAAGFTPGRFDQRQGVFVIRDQDAHSWVEVFVPRVGWVDFDPTPSTDETDQGGVLSRLYLGAAAGAVRAARWLAARLGFMVAAGFVLLTATLTARHLSRWWRRRPRLLRAGGSAEDRVTRAYRQAAQWLAVSGAPRAPAAAPWEYCRQIEQRLPRVAQDLGLLTEKYVAARFGRSRPAESDAAAALAALARLRGGLFGARALTAREV